MKNEEQLSFIIDVLKTISNADLIRSLLYGDYEDKGQINFAILCNDLFWWATADAESLTPDNLPILKQCIEEVEKLDEHGRAFEADILFCCRIRKMRPQKPYYKSIPEKLHPLFDACGPERIEGEA